MPYAILKLKNNRLPNFHYLQTYICTLISLIRMYFIRSSFTKTLLPHSDMSSYVRHEPCKSCLRKLNKKSCVDHHCGQFEKSNSQALRAFHKITPSKFWSMSDNFQGYLSVANRELRLSLCQCFNDKGKVLATLECYA